MRTKVIFTVCFLALLIAIMPGSINAAQWLPDYEPVDVGPELRTWAPTKDRIMGSASDFASAESTAAATNAAIDDCILDTKLWLYLDDFYGGYTFDYFYLIAETAGSELWVQTDLSWPAGDPRPTPVVTCEQAAYLLAEFDNNMYPTETSFFGTPDLHDGSQSLLEAWGYVPPGYYANSDGRQVVLVSNVRDDQYYDPTYPNYIAGFYSPTFEAYFDRNIMSIDSYQWEERVGPDGSRPYLYESVFAHEYQHLLHDDYDPDEVNWVNEGLSMFSEFLTGYIVGDDAYDTFQELPENSMTAWGDQGGREIVADYGLVFLYHMYLYEKFGQEFIQYEFLNQDNDISSIESTLAALNIKKTDFAKIYHDFAVAVLIDSPKSKYTHGFELLDVGIDIGEPGNPNPDAYDTPGAPPWGADYVILEPKGKQDTLYFDGADFSSFPTPWTSDGDVLYSGEGGALADQWAIFEAAGGGTLTFDTYWDIEDYWDFGFVQVSTDGGYTWTSLEGDYTTFDHDPDAHPDIIANLPGLTRWSCYYAADPCWINVSYDLGAYAGQDILIAFRYMTDWGTEFEGWFIDNVYVDGDLISDGSDAAVFKSLTELFPIENDFTVQLVGVEGKGDKVKYTVKQVRLKDATEAGSYKLTKFEKADYIVMLVTFDAPEGTTFYADYAYEVKK